jgi:phage terminase large subunit
MFIRFVNGSTWQVVGSDNYNSLVGSPPVGVVFSEWSLAKPEAWSYLRPILAENDGWVLFIWTPRGRNHATRAFEAREREGDWYTQRLPATKTDVFTAEQLERERRELISEEGSEEEGEARYRQEYMVDFNAAVPGSYYGRQISDAQDEGRIGEYSYDTALPVLTAWDIGVDDYTAVWFMQENGRQVRAIGYYETAGIGPEQIVPEALPELMPDKDKAAERLIELGRLKPYRYGEHFLPHDVMVREWGAGARTRFQTLRSLGVTPIRVGVAMDPADRINAGRRLFPFVHFDAEACAVGLDRLRNYRKRWNRSLMVYTGPLHDENSHGADAYGEFAVNCALSRVVKAEPPKEPKDRYHKKPARPVGTAWG